ncbi:MAG: hypothetical protein QM594_21125 [Niabella sp.]
MKINFSSLTIILSGLFFFFASCSKEKIDENIYEIRYKVEGSGGVAITSVRYNTDNDGGVEVITIPEEAGASSFESDTTYKLKQRNAYIVVYATGSDNNSTLKTQIFKNGVLAKEYTRTGKNLGTELGLP